jgi:hypothetical protein
MPKPEETRTTFPDVQKKVNKRSIQSKTEKLHLKMDKLKKNVKTTKECRF